MWTYTAIGSYVLVLSLLTVMVMILVANQQSSARAPVWLLTALVGIVLGGAASVALVQLLGYEVVEKIEVVQKPALATGSDDPSAVMARRSGGGMGMMMGGGGGGGGRGSNAKRQLTSLVRKLDLLTGDIQIVLTSEQMANIKTMLDDLAAADTMTDEDAQKKYDELLAVLDESQKAKQESIGLPFGRGAGGGGGGFGGGFGGGPGGPPGLISSAPVGPGGAPSGGPPLNPPPLGSTPPGPPPDSNPFTEVENEKALTELRAKVGGSTTEIETTTTPAPVTTPDGSTPEEIVPEATTPTSETPAAPTTPTPEAPPSTEAPAPATTP